MRGHNPVWHPCSIIARSVGMYWIYGLTLESDLAFPCLPERSAQDSSGVDLVLRVAPGLPPGVPAGVESAPLFERHVAGRLTLGVYQSREGVVFRYPGRVEFHLDADLREITCFRDIGCSEGLVGRIFLSLIIAFVLDRRGRQNLHASAVRVGDHAIAFLAPTGGGKSTLAAHFVSLGHPLLSEELLPIAIKDDDAWALPGPPQLRLLPDAENRYWPSQHKQSNTRTQNGKRLICLRLSQQHYCAKPLPLRAVYFVERSPAGVGIEPIGQREALVALVSSIYANFLSSGAALSAQLSALADLVGTLACSRLLTGSSLDDLPSVHAIVLDHMARNGPAARD